MDGEQAYVLDCTEDFVTDQTWPSRDDMFAWVRDRAERRGYVVVISSSSLSAESNRKPAVYLGCNRGGSYRGHRAERKTKRPIKTKKCDCPFRLRSNQVVETGVWTLTVLSGVHNHEGSRYVACQGDDGKLVGGAKEILNKLADKNVPPKEFMPDIKGLSGLSVKNKKDIYNARRLLKRGRITPIVRSLKELAAPEIGASENEKAVVASVDEEEENVGYILDRGGDGLELEWENTEGYEVQTVEKSVDNFGENMDGVWSRVGGEEEHAAWGAVDMEIIAGVNEEERQASEGLLIMRSDVMEEHVGMEEVERVDGQPVRVVEGGAELNADVGGFVEAEMVEAVLRGVDPVISNILSADEEVQLQSMMMEGREMQSERLEGMDTAVAAEVAVPNDAGAEAEVQPEKAPELERTHDASAEREGQADVAAEEQVPRNSSRPSAVEDGARECGKQVRRKLLFDFDDDEERVPIFDAVVEPEQPERRKLDGLDEVEDAHIGQRRKKVDSVAARGRGKVSGSGRGRGRGSVRGRGRGSGGPKMKGKVSMEGEEDQMNVAGFEPIDPRSKIPFWLDYPPALQPLFEDATNVIADGNCGYRSVALQLFGTEEKWKKVRWECKEEMLAHADLYKALMMSEVEYGAMLESVEHYSGSADQVKWMQMPDMGHVIASRFNCVLHYVGLQQCLTFFPLHTPPVPEIVRQEITLGHVSGNHFFVIKLCQGAPVPPTSVGWTKHHTPAAEGWPVAYQDRMREFRDRVGRGVNWDDAMYHGEPPQQF